jgi:putative FmdB family regulatory protein
MTMEYTFKCRSCGLSCTRTYRITEDKPESIVCENCGGKSHRVFGVPQISFKGFGFYKTDHKVVSKTKEKDGST